MHRRANKEFCRADRTRFGLIDFRALRVLVALSLMVASGSFAAAAPPTDSSGHPRSALPKRAKRIFGRIWSYRILYENANNPVLKKLALRGRFQADFPLFGGNQGSYSEAQVRRLRLGFKSHWLADLTLHVETDIDVSCEASEDCTDDAYEGLTDAYLQWAPIEMFSLKVGKLSAPFTLDGATSSNSLLSLERNNLSNNLWFPVEYHTGIGASGRGGAWRYRVGAYSSSTTENFGRLDGGTFFLATISHDFSQRLRVREALLTLDYVYNRADAKNVSTRDMAHVVSLHFRFDTGRWGVRSDLAGGIGYGTQSDLMGLVVMPFYHINDYFQVVARYTWLNSFDDNGVRFGRYESRIELGRGDRYDEIFAGLNWFIYGHQLKLQTGFKYTWMQDAARDGGDYRGWSWTTGLRLSW